MSNLSLLVILAVLVLVALIVFFAIKHRRKALIEEFERSLRRIEREARSRVQTVVSRWFENYMGSRDMKSLSKKGEIFVRLVDLAVHANVTEKEVDLLRNYSAMWFVPRKAFERIYEDHLRKIAVERVTLQNDYLIDVESLEATVRPYYNS